MSADGRSPFRPRQLDDLRLLPTKDDPRPTFFFPEPPRDGGDLTRGTPYPRLMWSVETGEEITVRDVAAHRQKQAEGGWTETPPTIVPVDPMADIQAELAALSETDRALVLEAQRQQRLQALQAKLAGLSERALDSLVGVTPQAPALPAPARPRGRPPKAV